MSEGSPPAGKGPNLYLQDNPLKTLQNTQTSQAACHEDIDMDKRTLLAIIDGLPILICVLDPDIRAVSINRSFTRLTGWTLTDLQKKDFLEQCYSECSGRDGLRAFLETPNGQWRRFPICTKDNKTADIAWAHSTLSDGFSVLAGVDCRDRMKAERDLLEYAVRLQEQTELIDLSHDSIIIHDLNGKITFWNQGSELLYGWNRKEAVGQITHHLLKTQFREPLIKIIAAVSSTGKWEGELVNTSKEGKTLTIESRWAIRKNTDGKPIAILEIDRDITRRKEDEQIAREALEYAESIIETVSEALVVLTPDLKVVSANERFYRMFGLTAEETLKKPLSQLGCHQWDIPDLRQKLSEILPLNTSLDEYVMEYCSFHTGRKTLHLNARQLYKEFRKSPLILLAIQDITARRRQEVMLKEMTEHLLLSEEIQRQEIATTLHDTIGQVLAHCKREMIALQKSTQGTAQQAMQKLIASMNNAIEQSRQLTMDLSSPTLHTFGLEAGIEEMAERFAEAHGIRCGVTSSEESKPLEKKVQLLLYRSVKELLSNVARHASADCVRINVRRQDRSIVITLEDNGKGFDTACLHEPTLMDKGIGLYSISQRIKNIGGVFEIHSRIDQGTSIILQAPLSNERETRSNSQ
jgi:PAS domain S-box-containing protein